MLYAVGTHISFTDKQLAPEPEPEREHTLYTPGTKIIFERLANFSGYIAKTIIPA